MGVLVGVCVCGVCLSVWLAGCGCVCLGGWLPFGCGWSIYVYCVVGCLSVCPGGWLQGRRVRVSLCVCGVWGECAGRYDRGGGGWGEQQAGRRPGRVPASPHKVAGLTAGRRRKLDVREISQRQIDSL